MRPNRALAVVDLYQPAEDVMADRERVVAIGLLTERDLAVLGQGFHRIFRIPSDEPFRDLLFQIDAADADLVRIVDVGRHAPT